MEQALLDQVVAWNDELNGLHDELAQDERQAAEELRTLIETLEFQIRPEAHDAVTLCASEVMVSDRPEADAYAHLSTNSSGIIVEVNQEAERLLNFPTKWLAGQPLLVFVARTERAGFLRAFLEFKREKLAGVQWLITLQPVKGDSFAVRLGCKPLYGGHTASLQKIDWSFMHPRYSQRSRPHPTLRF